MGGKSLVGNFLAETFWMEIVWAETFWVDTLMAKTFGRIPVMTCRCREIFEFKNGAGSVYKYKDSCHFPVDSIIIILPTGSYLFVYDDDFLTAPVLSCFQTKYCYLMNIDPAIAS